MTHDAPASHARRVSRGTRIGAAVFALGALATVACVVLFAVGVDNSSAPSWLAGVAAVATPVGLLIAAFSVWRDTRRQNRTLQGR